MAKRNEKFGDLVSICLPAGMSLTAYAIHIGLDPKTLYRLRAGQRQGDTGPGFRDTTVVFLADRMVELGSSREARITRIRSALRRTFRAR